MAKATKKKNSGAKEAIQVRINPELKDAFKKAIEAEYGDLVNMSHVVKRLIQQYCEDHGIKINKKS